MSDSNYDASWLQFPEHPWLVVCSLIRAADLLSTPETHSVFGSVVSIADVVYSPTSRHHRPSEKAIMTVPLRCVLTFDDVFDDDSYGVPPEPEDIARLIRFVRKVERERVGPRARTLIHCHAGISRSTAAGLIWLAETLGPGREEEAAAELVAACVDKEPFPNLTMVRYADEQLDRKGRLLSVAKNFSRLGGLLARSAPKD